MATPEQIKILNRVKKKAGNSYQKSRTKAPVARGQQLPAGIINGYARFSDFKLGESKEAKKPYVSLTGIVCMPEEFAGARATQMIWLCESDYNTMEEAIDELYNTAQLLGIDTTDAEFNAGMDVVFKHLEKLKKEKRPFKFNTTGSKRGTKVFIQGTLDEDELAALEASEGDETSEEESTDAVEEQEEEEGEVETESEETSGEATEGDYAGLGEAADEGDEDAITVLTEAAQAAGIDPDSIDTWVEVEAMLSGGSEEGDSDDGEFLPEVGQVFGYRVNAKLPARNCEVKTVNQAKQTVNLQRVDDGKDFKAIPWDKLEDAAD